LLQSVSPESTRGIGKEREGEEPQLGTKERGRRKSLSPMAFPKEEGKKKRKRLIALVASG